MISIEFLFAEIIYMYTQEHIYVHFNVITYSDILLLSQS